MAWKKEYYTERKKQYDLQYAKDHQKRIPLDVRKEYYSEVLKPAAEMLDMGVNTLIKVSVMEKIQRERLDLPTEYFKP